MSFQSLSFNGINNAVEIAEQPNLNPLVFTMELWLKITNTAQTFQTIMEKRYSAIGGIAHGIAIYYNIAVPKLKFYIGSPLGWLYVEGITTLQANIWYHIIATFDGATMQMYLNGISEGSYPVSQSSPIYDSATAQALRVGRGIDGYFMAGIIADVRFYNRVITQQEITYNYIHRDPSDLTGLVLWLPFNEASGNLALDASGNNNNGTIVGATRSTDEPSFAGVGYVINYQSTPVNVPLTYDGQTLASGQTSPEIPAGTPITISVPPEVTV